MLAPLLRARGCGNDLVRLNSILAEEKWLWSSSVELLEHSHLASVKGDFEDKFLEVFILCSYEECARLRVAVAVVECPELDILRCDSSFLTRSALHVEDHAI